MPNEFFVFPTSFAQQRLWFLDQMVPGNAFYNMSGPIRLSFPINIAILKKTLNEIVRRHEILRTTFKNIDGQPFQVVSSSMELDFPLQDLTHLPPEEREILAVQLATTDAKKPFDLAKGPLIRTSLLKLDYSDFIFLISIHHIIADAWSLDIFFQELATLYDAYIQGKPSPLAELPIQYADFAVWQREYLKDEVLAGHISYWKQKLSDIPQLALPLDRPRPAFQSFQGNTEKVELSKSLSESIKKFSQQENVTLFMTLLSGFVVLLYRYSQQEDIVVGAPIAGRNEKEIEPLMGFFVNSLVIRTDVSGNPSFRQLLQRVRTVVLEAFAHGDIPFEKLVEELHPERDLSRNPLFQVSFQFLQLPLLSGSSSNKQGSGFLGTDKGTALFDLRLSFLETLNGIEGEIEYSTDLFDQATIIRMANHFTSLLAGGIAKPDCRLSDLHILSENEKTQMLIEWNDTYTDFSQKMILHKLVEQQVEHSLNKIAVTFNRQSLTYTELNDQANQVAHYLRSRGIKQESLVGVCLERSEKMVIVLLGILKVGAAYIPLDPNYPKERLQFIVADSRMEALVGQRQLIDNFTGLQKPIVCLDEEWPQIKKEKSNNLSIRVHPENLAYIIYTSGSTGTPKGVLVSHAAICNHMLWMQKTFPLSESDTVIQRTPYSFDASVWEFYAPLIAGAKLVIIKQESHKDNNYLIEIIKSDSVTILQVVPSLLQTLLMQPNIETCTSLKRVFCGGEALPESLIEKFYSYFDAELYNLYGPTEATIDTTSWACWIEKKQERVPIGRPISNVQLYVLDHSLNPVPMGVSGELYIGGEGLARGYLNRPALTAEKFIPNPFAKQPGSRLYRTGDLVRYRPDGNVEFIERIDHQVKLRGYRIELGEIEGNLKKYPGVKDAVVLAQPDASGYEKLVAYIVQNSSYHEIADAANKGDWDTDQVNHWKMVYEEKIYGKAIEEVDANFNTIGWHSSYTGEPIRAEEMLEWVDYTVEQILSLNPRKVLEIGCGSGLILLRVAPYCEQYAGTDFSSSIIHYLRQYLQNLEDKLPPIDLYERTADNFQGFKEQSFDTVVLNSVIQYFPSINYLKKILEGALNVLSPGGAIFIGDVRCLPLFEAFHTSVELYQASSSLPIDQFRQRTQRQMNLERELVIDPQFFVAFSQEFPRITHVELRLKKGNHNNELTMFRYDVVLHIDKDTSDKTTISWKDWQKEKFTLEKLVALLKENKQPILGISQIPDGRINKILTALTAVKTKSELVTIYDLNNYIEELPDSSIDPNDIWKLKDQFNYTFHVGWWTTYSGGFYEVLVIRKNYKQIPSVIKSFLRDKYPVKEWHQYANNPLQGMFIQKLLPKLSEFLVERLPEYMVPSNFVILDKIPLKPNGKVDRQALPAFDTKKFELTGTYVAPKKLSEEILAKIWSEILGIERIGIYDNFFKDLGGHSLLAIQLISRVRDHFQIELPLQIIFEAPTIEKFAAIIEKILIKEIESNN